MRAVKEAMNLGVDFISFNRDEHDLKDMARRKKKSFYWYKRVIETNGEEL